MKRGEILTKALELLYDGAMDQVDFFAAVLTAGYGASMSEIDYEHSKLRRQRVEASLKDEEVQKKKRRLEVFISKMKHDGLIRESNGKKFSISKKGEEKLSKLKNSLPGRHYKKEEGVNNPVIISFDIPERSREKRNWLREVVKNLGFEIIHKSVWIGKGKVPKDFILDLEHLHILEFVEIFEVSKEGSLRKLI